ncbi:hypothetical protein [Pseudonocardia sp.]|uniref:hypothetical protein n=1 Tax=Pseudonocardia sp. TaxID=60912 RepID=UPI002621A322|nr:hypothetical protein [Pseudonocardia sp.]
MTAAADATRAWATRHESRATRRTRLSVAGVAGGVGATTVATAIGAADRGVYVGRAVDVLVCRATGDSLIRAGRAAQLVAAATGRKPVLAITAADASGPSRPVTAQLRLLEPHASAVIVLPFVRRWRELAVPLDEVRGLLAVPRTELPRSLRRYADAAHDLRAALDARAPAAVRPAPGRAAPTSILGRIR